ncbi:nitroreductase [Clostridium sp. MCC353]|uniref:nitroreductase family protein n=1 Tax=Clostridium sp. MCC353 TaxID=2592646 RepID=UPI001C02B9AF|nr:nitroreductase family protein [Clostridium sp. MCC353]MBT9777712.1 nitroreductase [Clostridium sp. MCC353]
MDLLEIMQNRRSVRTYTDEPISNDSLQKILQAGLLSASSRGVRPWELIVVRDKGILKQMSECRIGSAKMLSGADAAIVVIGNITASDVWVEDCSIVMSNMHLMADSLGIGSCWIQGRLREAPDGRTTENYLKELLKFPDGFALEAVLSLGMPDKHPAKRELSELPMNKIHYEVY